MNNELQAIFRFPDLKEGNDFLVLAASFFDKSDARKRLWGKSQGAMPMAYPSATSHYFGMAIDRAQYFLKGGHRLWDLFFRVFQDLTLTPAYNIYEAKRNGKKEAKKRDKASVEATNTELLRKARKEGTSHTKVETVRAKSAEEHAAEHRLSNLEQLALLVKTSKPKVLEQLQVIAALEKALAVLHSCEKAGEGHKNYQKYIDFADAVEMASPKILTNAAKNLRLKRTDSPTAQFWYDVALFDPYVKEGRRQAGTLIFPKTMKIPAVVLEPFQKYMRDSDVVPASPPNLIAWWKQRENTSATLRNFVLTLLARSASTGEVERVMSKVEWVDNARKARMLPENFLDRIMMAYHSDLCLQHFHRPVGRVDVSGRAKRERVVDVPAAPVNVEALLIDEI